MTERSSSMQVDELIKKHLGEQRVMQAATVAGDQPWVCTVFFVADAAQNLYWLSTPERRHSKEISENNKTSIAIVVKSDWPIIGIQSEGQVTVVKDPKVVKKVMDKYVKKYSQGADFYDNFVAGANQHELYQFTPKSIVLFDEVNFAGNPRQEWQPKA